MEKAVLDAIYYSDIPIPTITKTLLHYTCEKDFETILDQSHENVEIRKLLGNTNNISYKILHAISKMFKKLLIPMLNSLCIITREGNVIYIMGPENSNITTMNGIIKIDAVLAELNINSYMTENQTSLVNTITKIVGIFGVAGMTGWFGYNYRSDLNLFNFLKND